jgi:glycerophosphoryl diester phosphodiesterase
MFVIGHRGARALEPENTLRALRRGMECAPYVEVDVRVSRDRHLVVIHDATVDRTTNGIGSVGSLTLAELRELDAGEGERIPTLEEVLDLISRCGGGLVVEIKEPGSEVAVCATLARVRPDPLLVVSFHAEVFQAVGELLGDVATGLIYSRSLEDPVQAARAVHARLILPKFMRVTPELVEAAHAAGISVVPWTLNSEVEFARAVALGVDGFASDNPCKARDFLASHGE